MAENKLYENPVIRQIEINGTYYDINAAYINDGNNVGKTWADITSLVSTAFQVKVESDLPTISSMTDAQFKEYKSSIVLVPDAKGGEQDVYDEYIINGNDKASATWEQIGTTRTDLSNYAKKEAAATLTSSEPSNAETGETTVTVTGTANGSYDKANAQTGAAGAATADLDDGVASIAAQALSVEGSYEKATGLTGSVSLDAHAHTTTLATTSVDYVTGVDASKNINAVTSVSGGTVSTTASVLSGVSKAATITSAGTITVVKDVTFAAASTESLETNYTLTDTTFNDATVVASVTPASVKSSANFVTDIPNFDGGSASGTFVTAAIKSAALAEGTSTDGVGYIDGITSVAATLSGNTSPMKTATVSDGVLSWTTADVSVSGGTAEAAAKKYIKVATEAAATGNVQFTAASLGTLSKTLAVTEVEGGVGTPTSVLGSVNKAASIAAGKTTAVMTGMGAMTLSTDTVNTGYTFTDAQYTTETVVTGISAITTATATVVGGLSTKSFANVTGVTVNESGAATIDASKFGIAYATASITSAGTLAAFTASVAGKVTVADHTHSIGFASTTISLGVLAEETSPHTHTMSHTHTVASHNHPNA